MDKHSIVAQDGVTAAVGAPPATRVPSRSGRPLTFPTHGMRAELAPASVEVTVVSVAGDIDIASAEVFETVVFDALSAGQSGRVVLELNRVTFLATRGLGVLAAAQHRARQHGTELVLVVDDVAPAASTLSFLSGEDRPVVSSSFTAAVQQDVVVPSAKGT